MSLGPGDADVRPCRGECVKLREEGDSNMIGESWVSADATRVGENM